MLVRDDGSSDETLQILNSYRKKDSRIKIINDSEPPTGSAEKNFAILVKKGLKTSCSYFFFADQDDIWKLDKIEKQWSLMTSENKDKPILIHHDLIVLSHKNKNASSFFKFMGLSPKNANFLSLLGRNEITGCSISCNRATLVYAHPFPSKIIMHDWWLALVSSAYGKIITLEEPLAEYRQHESNNIGAKSIWHAFNPFTNWIKGWERGNVDFFQTMIQAECFLKKNEINKRTYQLKTDDLESLKQYVNILKNKRLQRILTVKNYGLVKNHWLLALIFCVRLLTLNLENFKSYKSKNS